MGDGSTTFVEMYESLVNRLVELQGSYKVGGSMSVAGSTEDLVLLLPKNPEPGAG